MTQQCQDDMSGIVGRYVTARIVVCFQVVFSSDLHSLRLCSSRCRTADLALGEYSSVGPSQPTLRAQHHWQ